MVETRVCSTRLSAALSLKPKLLKLAFKVSESHLFEISVISNELNFTLFKHLKENKHVYKFIGPLKVRTNIYIQ